MTYSFQSVLLFVLFQVISVANADVVLDRTLGNGNIGLGPNFAITADLGKQQGNNLFHSFQDFSLESHQKATFYGPTNITNIISRVTGDNPSYINGTLESKIDGANLYFLNPNGITFGKNAYLDIPGSFHVSTADYLLLGNNGRFDAKNPINSVFTVAPPTAFGFLSEKPAEIVKEASSTNLLTVPKGKTISIIGGHIALKAEHKDKRDHKEERNTFYAPEGTINVVSVASSGELPINPKNMRDDAFAKFGTIEITDNPEIYKKTILDTSGNNGGNIFIKAGNIFISDTNIWADIWNGTEDGNQGGIKLSATDKLSLTGKTRITSETYRGVGTGADINITAKEITLSAGAQIATTAHGKMDAGNISVTATDKIEMSGFYLTENQLTEDQLTEEGKTRSGLLTNTHDSGNGGQINIETPILTLNDGSAISTQTKSKGNAGNIKLQLDSLILKNGGLINVASKKTDSSTDSFTDNMGNGGTLKIEATKSVLITGKASYLKSNTDTDGNGGNIIIASPKLEILNGGIIHAGTEGNGMGGEIFIDVSKLDIRNGSITVRSEGKDNTGHGGLLKIDARESILVDGTDSFVESKTQNSGNAGNIIISSPKLEILNGGMIHAGTDGDGMGGGVYIKTDQLNISNNGSITVESTNQGNAGKIKIFTSALEIENNSIIKASTEGKGMGGEIFIKGEKLDIRDSTITAESMGKDNAGDAGNIFIDIKDWLKVYNGSIRTETQGAEGGSIEITSPNYLSLTDGMISTSVHSKDGNSGNITIQPKLGILDDPKFIILKDSRIKANAFEGNGGNIDIKTTGIYNFGGGSLEKVITASSERGIDGEINIDSPEQDVLSLIPITTADFVVKETFASRCLSIGKKLRFIKTTRDVSPPTPYDLRK